MFESPFCHVVAVKMGASLKILRLPLREMKSSKLSGACFFCFVFLHEQKMKSTFRSKPKLAAVKVAQPLG
ncbi:hypothetical protein JL12_11565 [Gallibacterium anatis 10672-6]|nr:hypothetical protein JL12_11565 [Gallibacterium anatis 10672-6]